AESITVDVDAVDGVVTITVRDDGVGFDPAARAIRERRLGLTSMRERAESLGGKPTVVTAPRAGTTVRVKVPSGLVVEHSRVPGRRPSRRAPGPAHVPRVASRDRG